VSTDLLQKSVTVVVRPTEQQPDIEQPHQNPFRPSLLGITYFWTAEELRGTEGDLHGQVEVRVQGEWQREGRPYSGDVPLRWDNLATWPLWVKEIVGQHAPQW